MAQALATEIVADEGAAGEVLPVAEPAYQPGVLASHDGGVVEAELPVPRGHLGPDLRCGQLEQPAEVLGEEVVPGRPQHVRSHHATAVDRGPGPRRR